MTQSVALEQRELLAILLAVAGVSSGYLGIKAAEKGQHAKALERDNMGVLLDILSILFALPPPGV